MDNEEINLKSWDIVFPIVKEFGAVTLDNLGKHPKMIGALKQITESMKWLNKHWRNDFIDWVEFTRLFPEVSRMVEKQLRDIDT